MIDTHSHLHVKEFDADRAQAIARAQEAGVKILINVGFDPEGNASACALAQAYGAIYWTAGIHPHHADLATSENLNWMREKAKSPAGKKLVAIGEIGLDYFKNLSPKDAQIASFRAQLALSGELSLPVIVHCRDAFADTLEILRAEKIKRAVFHCFTGTMVEARECWSRGYLTSFTGICTYPSAVKVRAAILEAPVDKIMIETDCPYLSPQRRRGQRNEPCFLPEILEKIAEIKGLKQKEIEASIEQNTKKFFKIP